MSMARHADKPRWEDGRSGGFEISGAVRRLRERVWLAWRRGIAADVDDAPAFQEALATFAMVAGVPVPALYWVRRATENAWSLPMLGVVACSPSFLQRFPADQQREIAAHEIAHLALGHRRTTPEGERAADALAAQWCGRSSLTSRPALTAWSVPGFQSASAMGGGDSFQSIRPA